jgi:hypothetical protein
MGAVAPFFWQVLARFKTQTELLSQPHTSTETVNGHLLYSSAFGGLHLEGIFWSLGFYTNVDSVSANEWADFLTQKRSCN